METLNKCFPGVTQSKVLCVCMLWMCSFKRYFFFKILIMICCQC